MAVAKLIGRDKERAVLENALRSNEAELISVVGRRRVGKTFLVKSVYVDSLRFSLTGLPNSPKKTQLSAFVYELNKIQDDPTGARDIEDWLSAFFALATHFDKHPPKDKFVIFFDEVPWLATKRSGFIEAFSWLWNSWAIDKNVVVVICGSAASWMVQKVVRDRGGLHNRITKRINVQPFNLYTTSKFLEYHGLQKNNYNFLQLYMAMGGIPHYLKEVKSGQTAAQNIDRICLDPGGLLYDEFDNLYPALFDDHERHVEIIEILAGRPNGLSRQQILAATKLSSGGRFSKILEELLVSGFVSETFGFGKKRKRYRLIDEYSLFYLKFIRPMKRGGADTWVNLSQTSSYRSWSGYAFENIGMRHISQIKNALGIAGIFTRSAAYYHSTKDGVSGVQIDLVIDRNDNAINLCEFKFYKEKVALGKQDEERLLQRKASFRYFTKTRKLLFWTMISPYGMADGNYNHLVDNSFTMDILFQES